MKTSNSNNNDYQIVVITLFPEMFKALTDYGVISRAFSTQQVQISFINPRDFVTDNHKTIDDRPFGGGPGMVMLAEPLAQAIQAAKEKLPEASVVYLSPKGEIFNQSSVPKLLEKKSWIFLCGRYEGVDQRLLDHYVDAEISIGNFVVSGGELPLMCLLDAMIRHMPGVLGDELSALQDSFADPVNPDLLDCPHYTRPPVWRGHAVPEVLLSGHHKHIAAWRLEQSKLLTLKKNTKNKK